MNYDNIFEFYGKKQLSDEARRHLGKLCYNILLENYPEELLDNNWIIYYIHKSYNKAKSEVIMEQYSSPNKNGLSSLQKRIKFKYNLYNLYQLLDINIHENIDKYVTAYEALKELQAKVDEYKKKIQEGEKENEDKLTYTFESFES